MIFLLYWMFGSCSPSKLMYQGVCQNLEMESAYSLKLNYIAFVRVKHNSQKQLTKEEFIWDYDSLLVGRQQVVVVMRVAGG